MNLVRNFAAVCSASSPYGLKEGTIRTWFHWLQPSGFLRYRPLQSPNRHLEVFPLLLAVPVPVLTFRRFPLGTQWDMFLAFVGAMIAQLSLSRIHDKFLDRLKLEPVGNDQKLFSKKRQRRPQTPLLKTRSSGVAIIHQKA
jgi:hypothetical protein